MQRLVSPGAFRLVILGLALSGFPGGACAQQWGADADGARAGYKQNGRYAGLLLECGKEGGLRILASGNGANYPADRDMTVILSVDGFARRLTVRAEPEPAGGGSRFAATEPAGEAADLVAALRKGKVLEVSSPAGTIRLPLAGSGKALAALTQACKRGG